MSDFDEARVQHMEKEAPDELIGWEGNQSGFFGIAIIPRSESDLAVLAVD